MDVQRLRWSPEEILVLRGRFQHLPEVSLFRDHPELAAKVACHGLQREIGTVNDELARFIFDADSGRVIRRESLRGTIVQWRGLIGVRIGSADSVRMELRTPGFYDVVHPGLSRNEDGTLHSLFIFPDIVERIARAEGLDLVLVKSWGMNSIFGGFDPAKGHYQPNFWELENNDTIRFADLIRQGRLAFLGTHDLIAHIAGADGASWPRLRSTAARVSTSLQSYFASVPQPGIASLILPYTIGVVLDDLAQPPSAGSASHHAVLEELLKRLEAREIPADLRALLTRYPAGFQNVIELARQSGAETQPALIQATVDRMIREVQSAIGA